MRVVVGIVVAGAAAWACGSDDGGADDVPTQVPLAEADTVLREAYCARVFDCGCEIAPRFATEEQCDAFVDEAIADLRARAEATGLRYDPTCIGGLVDQLDDDACTPYDDDDHDDDVCEVPCRPLIGDRLVGQPCIVYDDWTDTDCAQGLECSIDECLEIDSCTGHCVDPCDGACVSGCAEDQVCNQSDGTCEPLPTGGQPCGYADACAEGFTCQYDIGTAICAELPDAGESCGSTGRCRDDLDCRFDPMLGDSLCFARVGLGEPCSGHRQCTSGYCPAGACVPLPGRGESCAGTSACADGLFCRPPDFVCGDNDPTVCWVDTSIL